jgi:ABC-type dipeptide/oligopeptide/nickel transport system ATPase subunit
MSLITLDNLSVSHRQGYELRTVVHDVSLHIEQGECFGLVGPSGCGKSSLLWVLAGLNEHWSGEFHLLGRDLQPGRPFTGTLRREVQMVFQDPYASLHPKHRLLRTLAEPLKLLKESDIEQKITLLPSATIDPHSAVGGATPIPRKPKPAADKIIPPRLNAARTTALGRHSGNIWPAISRKPPMPCIRAAAR